jgi:hypothetical protein
MGGGSEDPIDDNGAEITSAVIIAVVVAVACPPLGLLAGFLYLIRNCESGD